MNEQFLQYAASDLGSPRQISPEGSLPDPYFSQVLDFNSHLVSLRTDFRASSLLKFT